MRNNIDPFPIITQQTAPHLVWFIGFDLPLETAMNGTEHDSPAAHHGLAGFVGDQFASVVVLQGVDAGLEEAADEMRA